MVKPAPHVHALTHASSGPAGKLPGSTRRARIAYSAENPATACDNPTPQASQPMGFSGRFHATNAPIGRNIANATEKETSTAVKSGTPAIGGRVNPEIRWKTSAAVPIPNRRGGKTRAGCLITVSERPTVTTTGKEERQAGL